MTLPTIVTRHYHFVLALETAIMDSVIFSITNSFVFLYKIYNVKYTICTDNYDNKMLFVVKYLINFLISRYNI